MNIMMMFFEILGTIAFSVSGAIEAMKKGMDMLGVMVLGLVTAVGGGVMRDIFAGNMPYIFRKHVYATASIAGSTAYLCLEKTGYVEFAAVASLVMVVILRLLAAHFKWNLPRVNLNSKDGES